MQPSNGLWALDRRGLALANCPAPKALLQGDTLSGWWKLEALMMMETIQQGAWRRGQRGWKNEASGRSWHGSVCTSLWAPSFFLRYIPLHVYQRFSWGQSHVNERPLRLRRKGKMLWHLQQRADPSRLRAEKYTIDTSLTNTSVCFVFPCLNAALKPVQLPGSEPKRLFYLHGPVATIKTRSVHVASTCHACDVSCDGMRASAWLSSRPSRAA